METLDRTCTLDRKAPEGMQFIAGEWASRDAGRHIEVQSPSDGLALGRIAAASAETVDEAVAAARAALAGEWGRLGAAQRGRLLMKLSDIVLRDLERLAWIEALDTGKPISTARADIKVLARYFEFYAGGADKIHGQVIPFEPGYSVQVVRVPHGVTAHIIPWNYPVQMFGRSVAPALAMGNACVVKPAEDASLTSLEIAALAAEAGFPAGALNIVTGYGAEAGAALAGHRDINYVSFTGSPRVGMLIQQAAAVNSVPVCLELGGKSPQIVFADADLDRAAATVVRAITQNTGQTCSAGSRVLVERGIFDAFMQKVAAGFQKLRVGCPEDDADLGPVINDRQRKAILQYVSQAQQDGIAVIAQTELRSALPERGHFVAPVVLGPVPAMHPIAQEEIFGPVLAATPFDTEDEAVELANGTQYALAAGIWTRDGDRFARMATRLVTGQCFINCYGAGGGVELPFGGSRRSGHGREKGFVALEELSSTKTIVHYHG